MGSLKPRHMRQTMTDLRLPFAGSMTAAPVYLCDKNYISIIERSNWLSWYRSGVNKNHYRVSDILSDIYALTQNLHIHCSTSPPSDCLSVCRHHGIGGCTSVHPVLGTLCVVYTQYLLVLCQQSSDLLPCKLTGCRGWVRWGHGTCDWQWPTFDHLLLVHWS